MAGEFVGPSAALRVSFLEMIAEFRADPDVPVPWFVADVDPAALTDVAAFDAYVARVVGEREADPDRPAWFVPMTTLWWCADDVVLGRLAIRHRLTAALENAGGHIGYDVRPSARRQGHATAMLRAALPIAYGLGIDPALLTCDRTNVVSRRVIEANGGRYVDSVGDRLRFSVATR